MLDQAVKIDFMLSSRVVMNVSLNLCLEEVSCSRRDSLMIMLKIRGQANTDQNEL